MAITINGSGITSANIADGTITASDISASEVKNLKSGRKNLIINGGFDVWQRGTSFTAQGYTADRWVMWLSGGTATATKEAFTLGQTDVPGEPTNYLKVATSVGNNNCGLEYRVEGVRTGAGQTVTVSFYAKGVNPAGGNLRLNFYQYFGSSGSSSPGYTPDQDIVLTSSWQKFTFTTTLASITGKTISGGDDKLYVSIGQPQGDTSTNAWELNLANVQLELGSVATDFEHRSYGEELALCQRYYWQGKLSDSFGRRYGTANGGYLDAGNASFPVTMRGTSNPDVAIVTDPTYDGCVFYSTAVNVHGLNLRITKNTNSGLYRAYNGVFSADAEL